MNLLLLDDVDVWGFWRAFGGHGVKSKGDMGRLVGDIIALHSIPCAPKAVYFFQIPPFTL